MKTFILERNNALKDRNSISLNSSSSSSNGGNNILPNSDDIQNAVFLIESCFSIMMSKKYINSPSDICLVACSSNYKFIHSKMNKISRVNKRNENCYLTTTTTSSSTTNSHTHHLSKDEKVFQRTSVCDMIVSSDSSIINKNSEIETISSSSNNIIKFKPFFKFIGETKTNELVQSTIYPYDDECLSILNKRFVFDNEYEFFKRNSPQIHRKFKPVNLVSD